MRVMLTASVRVTMFEYAALASKPKRPLPVSQVLLYTPDASYVGSSESVP